MTNVSTLQQLSYAKQSHLLWVKEANDIILGFANNKKFISFDSTECGLGVWLKIEGKKIYHIYPLRRLIDKIEEQHNKLHNIYLNIYQISFMIPKQTSFFQKLFNFNKKLENKEVQEAIQLHREDIQQSANQLLKLLEVLEEQIKEFASKKIEAYSHIQTLQTAS